MQAMNNLGDVVKKDCKLIEESFEKYGKLYSGPNDMYKMVDDPSFKDISKLKFQLRKDLTAWNKEKTFVIYILASHGIQENGSQGVVVNEFDKKTEFYKIWKIEALIRYFAKTYPNSYHLAIFACCREVYDPFRHTGCVGGSYEEAVA